MSARPCNLGLMTPISGPMAAMPRRVDTAQRIVDDSEDFIFAELLWRNS